MEDELLGEHINCNDECHSPLIQYMDLLYHDNKNIYDDAAFDRDYIDDHVGDLYGQLNLCRELHITDNRNDRIDNVAQRQDVCNSDADEHVHNPVTDSNHTSNLNH